MGWSLGYDTFWKRDIGYGVPAFCDYPDCDKEIDRGLTYVCGGQPYGGDEGCGLFFCEDHRKGLLCERCDSEHPDGDFKPKPDHPKWIKHKLEHESWEEWRKENPKEVAELEAQK